MGMEQIITNDNIFNSVVSGCCPIKKRSHLYFFVPNVPGNFRIGSTGATGVVYENIKIDVNILNFFNYVFVNEQKSLDWEFESCLKLLLNFYLHYYLNLLKEKDLYGNKQTKIKRTADY